MSILEIVPFLERELGHLKCTTHLVLKRRCLGSKIIEFFLNIIDGNRCFFTSRPFMGAQNLHHFTTYSDRR